MPIESLTNSKVDGDASYQDTLDNPCDNSDCGSEPSHGINAVRKQVKNLGPKEQHRPSCHGKKLPGRDGPSQKSHHHKKKLPDTLEKNEVLMVLFHLRKHRLYSKASKVPAFSGGSSLQL